ncbi:MAG: MoaD/ThiS family protein [Thermoplasmataceae archaeon]
MQVDENSGLHEVVNSALSRCGESLEAGGILVAVNMEYCRENVTLKEGDEVAIMPLVTGG